MEIISLLVKSRRGVPVNATVLFDVDDIAAPIMETNGGADTIFTIREGKKGPFPNQATNTAITEYVVDQTLAQIAVLAGSVFTSSVTSYKGRVLPGNPTMGFNAKFIAGIIYPHGSGSKFMYQEDSDPDLVEYTVRSNPAAILAQITTNSTPVTGWALNGNTNAALKYIGTNNNFDFPVYVNGAETFRFLTDGTIKYPLGASNGYVLTSDGTGVGTWQAPSGIASTSAYLDPVIDELTGPPIPPPTLGDRYLIDSPAVGAWAGQENNIAEWDGAAWQFTVPVLDNLVYITSTLSTLRFDGVAWVSYIGTAILQYGNSLGSTMKIGTKDVQSLQIMTSGVARLFISPTGDVSIGTASVGAKLTVRGAGITNATYAIIAEQSGGLSIFQVRNDGSVWANGAGHILSNTTFGFDALINNTTGSVNAAYGANALKFNLTGQDCVAIGYNALIVNTAGNRNTAVGSISLQNSTGVSSSNTGIGYGSLVNVTSGSNNTAIGEQSLGSISVASGCVAIGRYAGFYETGSNKLFIDNDTRANEADGREKALVYGIFDAATANQLLRFNANVGIGVNPTVKLHSYTDASTIPNEAILQSTRGGVNLYLNSFTTSQDTSGGSNIYFNTGGATKGYITTNTANSRFILGSATYDVFIHKNSIAGIYIDNTVSISGNGTYNSIIVKANGNVNMANLPTSNAGLATGDMYVDTAANILSNGDLVVGWKV
jgi:hypothetical protein